MQSQECSCGTVAHDIVKHIMMSCPINLKERDLLFNNICDLLDVKLFVKLWSDEEELFLSFLLGGMPVMCQHSLEHNVWENVMLKVSSTLRKWDILFRNAK